MVRWTALAIAVGLIVTTVSAHAAEQRPFRGTVGISVLLCKYKDAPAPAKSRQFYENLIINSGTTAHADYWSEVSDGSIKFTGSRVKGWYTLDQKQAEAEAYGGGGSDKRILKHRDCVDKAKQQGYTPPGDHLVVVITSPKIDTFGFRGGAFLGEDAGVGVIAHEVGHGLSLNHSFSDDPNECNAGWANVGEYDDQWDAMSYANVFKRDLGTYGRGGPWLNAYHLDRMGWLDRRKIFRFGADGVYDRLITLTAVSRPDRAGYMMARVPFDPRDLYRYYTVEYRVPDTWDSGIGQDRVMIREVKAVAKTKCADGSQRGGEAYNSYLIRDTAGSRTPRESINRNGVRIDLVSKNAATGKAVVRIRSQRPARCKMGFVWREARSGDRVCVTPQRRTQVRQENRLADQRRQPGGGAYGPDTCRQGYVWREAVAGDRTCVRPQSRTQARRENRAAFERRIGGAAYGPNTCASGYVWREADAKDWVCVRPARRAQVRDENRRASARRSPTGGAYGPDTCLQGYVWREAFPGDRVCVSPSSRSRARQENADAHRRLARKES